MLRSWGQCSGGRTRSRQPLGMLATEPSTAAGTASPESIQGSAQEQQRTKSCKWTMQPGKSMQDKIKEIKEIKEKKKRTKAKNTKKTLPTQKKPQKPKKPHNNNKKPQHIKHQLRRESNSFGRKLIYSQQSRHSFRIFTLRKKEVLTSMFTCVFLSESLIISVISCFLMALMYTFIVE